MYIKDINFHVAFADYTERHFCKDFAKRYGLAAWLTTKQTIQDILERAFGFQETNLIDLIRFKDNQGIFKLDFRIAGTNFSTKASGNRAIFHLCNNTGRIEILLVYSKDHCSKKQSETRWILEHVKNNFPEYRSLI